MSVGQVEQARKKREASSVALSKLLSFRSAYPNVPVAMIEGKDDVSVWSIWFGRCGKEGELEPIPCGGKRKVLEVREKVLKNKKLGPSPVLYFVDCDFDDNTELEAEKDVLVTDRYSIENYFLSRNVLDFILNAHFHCGGDFEEKDRVFNIFRDSFSSYRQASEEVHCRAFALRRSGVAGISFPDRLGDIVSLDGPFSFAALSRECIDQQLPLEISQEEWDGFKIQFAELDFLMHGRGKFHKAFLRQFLSELQDDRPREPRLCFSQEKSSSHFKFSSLNLAECAPFSDLPVGLAEFLECNLT